MAGNVSVDDNEGTYYSYCLMAEDVVRDGAVDVQDVMAVVEKWRVRNTDEGWDPRLDLARDGVINIVDVMRVVKRWGAGCQVGRTNDQ